MQTKLNIPMHALYWSKLIPMAYV